MDVAANCPNRNSPHNIKPKPSAPDGQRETLTGDRSLDVDHRLLGAQQRRAFLDDAQRGRLLYASFQDKVLLEHLGQRFAGFAQVENLGDSQLVRGREQDA